SINYIIFTPLLLITVTSYNIRTFPREIGFLLSVLIVSAMGVFYAPDKASFAKQWLSLLILCYTCLVVYLNLSKIDWAKLLELMFWVGAIYTLLSFVSVNKLVDYTGAYVGISENRHNTSLAIGFLSVSSFAMLKLNRSSVIRFFGLAIIAINQYLIYVTTARVGYFLEFTFILMLLPYYMIRKSSAIKNILLVAIAITVCVYVLYAGLGDELSVYLEKSIDRGSTGRGEINSALLYELISNGPLFILNGFGIGALEANANLTEHFIRDSTNVVATMFTIGIIGLFFYVIFFIKLVICIIYEKSDEYSVLLAALALCIFLIPSETTWLNYNDFTTFFMYLFGCSAIKFCDIKVVLHEKN
ncbi:hypothetical protein, partial [Vibrio campbellii]|uniref:hypothetical protein n=1 Tax=Vibrio campbellii TaxID=680 RepID=UPI0005EF769A